MATDMSALTRRLQDVLAPLGAEEEQRAIRAALWSIGERAKALRVRGAELAIEKSENRRERPYRRVRVLFTAPDENVVREVLVDADGRVVSDRELGPRNLPFLPSEIERARAIAERDEQVAKAIAGYEVGVGTFAPTLRDAGRNRRVGLHFLDIANPDLPRPLTSVVVDLAAGALVHETHDHEPGEV